MHCNKYLNFLYKVSQLNSENMWTFQKRKIAKFKGACVTVCCDCYRIMFNHVQSTQ